MNRTTEMTIVGEDPATFGTIAPTAVLGRNGANHGLAHVEESTWFSIDHDDADLPVAAPPSHFLALWHDCLRQLRNEMPLIATDSVVCGVSLLAVVFGAGLIGITPFPWQPALLLMIPGLIACLAFAGVYPGIGMSPVVELRRLSVGATAAVNVLMLMFMRDGSLVSATLLGIAMIYMLLLLGLPFGRAIARRVLSRSHWWGEPILVLGVGSEGRRVFETLRRQMGRGVRPVGMVNELDCRRADDSRYQGYLYTPNQIPGLVRRQRIRWAIVAEQDQWNLPTLEAWRKLAGTIPNILVEQQASMPSLWTRSRECGGRATLHLTDGIGQPLPSVVKRTMDILISATLLLVGSPLFLALVVAIKLASPGPILFRQERYGRNGRRFKAWKFRTMVANASEALKVYLAEHPDAREEWEATHKLKNDPRVIPVLGEALRRWSLDELPQLWNVLAGEMSLVGPRPIVRDEIAKYESDFLLYQRVRPGITGLWQVSGRNDTDYKRRVQLDKYYVCNWSPWLDTYILFKTIPTVLFGRGAY